MDSPPSTLPPSPSRIADDAARNKVLHLIRSGVTLHEAAAAVGTTRQSLHRYMRSHPEFRQAVDDAKASRDAAADLIESIEAQAKAGRTKPRAAPPLPEPDPPRPVLEVEVVDEPLPQQPEVSARRALPLGPEPAKTVDAVPVDLPSSLFDAGSTAEVRERLREFALDPGMHPLVRNTALIWWAKITVGVEHYRECKRIDMEMRRELLRAEAELAAAKPPPTSAPLLIYGIPRNGSEAPGHGPGLRVVGDEPE